MRERFITKKFSASSRVLITTTNQILEDYARRGYDLTLRQLYYQFVAHHGLLNKQTEYKRLGSIVNDARLAGEIDWKYLVDRTRNLEIRSHWRSPAEIIAACTDQYFESLWENQDWYVECWVEKDALIGVLERACHPLDVPYFACRGYPSVSEMKSASERVRDAATDGKNVRIIHLGDHDPSGMDMSRDIEDRLSLLSRGPVSVLRIALNMDQIEQYNPPPNPAKLTDSRATDYIHNYGESSWELDALDPDILVELITAEVDRVRDMDQWEKDMLRVNTRKRQLQIVSNRWDEVTEFIGNEE